MADPEITTTDAPEALPKSVEHFDILRKLGEGGMGVVYLARSRTSGALVALKVLNTARWGSLTSVAPHIRDDLRNEVLRRFRAEPFALSAVQHPGLVACYEVGKTRDGEHFMAMEYVRGLTLDDHLTKHFNVAAGPNQKRERRRRRAELARLGHQLAVTLAALHEKSIVHRDIKPDNILVVGDPFALKSHRIKVLDVGIAKIPPEVFTDGEPPPTFTLHKTAAMAILGTPFYMAPEQWGAAANVTAKADVFALGQTLYGCLAMFGPDGPPDILPVIRERDPDVESKWIELITAMTAQDPAGRPAMAEVALRLQELARVSDDTTRFGPEFAEAVFAWENGKREVYPEPARFPELAAWGALQALMQGETEFLARFERHVAETKLKEEHEQAARAAAEAAKAKAAEAAARKTAKYLRLACGFLLMMSVGAAALGYLAFRSTRHAEKAAQAARDEAIKNLTLANYLDAQLKNVAVLTKAIEESEGEKNASIIVFKSADKKLDDILDDPKKSLEEKARAVRLTLEEVKGDSRSLLQKNSILRAERGKAEKERDGAIAEKTSAVAERDTARRAEEIAKTALDKAIKDKKDAEAGRSAAMKEKEAAEADRDKAQKSKEAAETAAKNTADAAYNRGLAEGKMVAAAIPAFSASTAPAAPSPPTPHD